LWKFLYLAGFQQHHHGQCRSLPVQLVGSTLRVPRVQFERTGGTQRYGILQQQARLLRLTT
jgi:hypothetical protein